MNFPIFGSFWEDLRAKGKAFFQRNVIRLIIIRPFELAKNGPILYVIHIRIFAKKITYKDKGGKTNSIIYSTIK